MSGLERLSAIPLSGVPTAGQVPVYNSVTGKFDPGAPKYDPFRNLYNFGPTSLYNWRVALARARNAGASARLALVGDSTTQGINGSANAATSSYPARLRPLLAPAATGLTVTDGLVLMSNLTNDARYTSVPSGWGTSGVAGFGSSVAGGTGASGPLTMSITGSDRFRVYFAKDSGLGTCAVTVNDGSGHTLSAVTAGASGVGYIEFTGLTPGVQTISFAVPTVNTVFFLAWETYASAGGQLMVMNEGTSGAASSSFGGTSTGYAGLGTLSQVGAARPDLYVLCIGINDFATNIVPATYQTNMQAVITAFKTSIADLLILVPVPPGGVQTYAWSQYVTIMYALADANNLPLLDLTARWVDYTTSNTKGLRADSLHPNLLGYYDVAQAVATVAAPV